MKRMSIVAALALLTACGRDTAEAPKAPPPATTPPVATEPPALEPVTARGNEPFWSAEVSGRRMTVTRPDAQPKTFAVRDQLTVERHIGAGPRSTTKVVKTEDPGIQLTLTEAACSDGMSDMTYKMAAELKLGGETLKGCAFFKADPPKQP